MPDLQQTGVLFRVFDSFDTLFRSFVFDLFYLFDLFLIVFFLSFFIGSFFLAMGCCSCLFIDYWITEGRRPSYEL